MNEKLKKNRIETNIQNYTVFVGITTQSFSKTQLT